MKQRGIIRVIVLPRTKKVKACPKVSSRSKDDDARWTIPSAISELTSITVPATPKAKENQFKDASTPSSFPVQKPKRKLRKERREKKHRYLKAWIIVLLILLVTSGMAVGIYFLIRSTVKTTTQPSITNGGLRWNPIGVTVVGATNASLLDQPLDIAVQSVDAFYVVEYGHNRVQLWSISTSTGQTIAGRANGSPGNTSADLSYPNGLYVDSNNNVYVADGSNNRIQLWNNGASSGTTVAGTGMAGSANNQFQNPYGLAMDLSTGTLFISDSNNHRVMSYSNGATAGTLVAGRNMSGINNMLLSSPTGIYFDALTSSIIIANFGSHNVVRWTLGANSWTLLAGSNDGSSGNSSSMLFSPRSVTLDPMGNMYVADSGNSRIQLFLPGQTEGRTVAGISTVSGRNASQLSLPCAVRLDSQLNLLVADAGNNRVQKFSRY